MENIEYRSGAIDSPIEPKLSAAIHRRQTLGLNSLVGIWGDRGAGKSTTALKLCETWDPRFSLDNCTFDSEKTIERIDHVSKWSWLILDEAGQISAGGESGGGAPARDWTTFRNKAISSCVQTFRDDEKMASLFVVSILPFHIDIHLRNLADFWLWQQGWGRLKCYSVKRSIFTGQISTPFLCNLRVGLPSPELFEAYKDKRRAIIAQRRHEYLKEMRRRREQVERGIAPVDHYVNRIFEEGLLEQLKVEGREIGQRGWFDRSKAIRVLGIGHTMSDMVKKALEESVKQSSSS